MDDNAQPDTVQPDTVQLGAAPAAPAAPALADPGLLQKIRFDRTNVKASYCNVCNATSTREEVVINFGINKTWELGSPEVEVSLEHRIVLNPHAAKRLRDMLSQLLVDHEKRHGELN